MENYLGETRLFAGNFAPRGWHFCDGSLLSIAANDTLYSLIGTTYGGDGVTTFGLPDLRGRIPVGQGIAPGLSNRTLGEAAGTESVTVLTSQCPPHSHVLFASTATATSQSPEGAVTAQPANGLVFYAPPVTPTVNPVAFDKDAITPVGGNQPHSNLMASQAVNYIIALEGIYPSRS
jgi:microcystin-dependent protein